MYYKHDSYGEYGTYVEELPVNTLHLLNATVNGASAWYDGNWFYTLDGDGIVERSVVEARQCILEEWTTGLAAAQYTPPTPAAYPDDNPKSVQGAKKHTLRYSPTAALIHMNSAFADGASKYGPANWREKGVATSVYIDAALRHIALYFDGGEQVASDSKAHHLGHAMACLAIILDAEAAGTLKDDRPTPMPNLEALLKRT